MASRDPRSVKRAPSRRLTAQDVMARDPICVTEKTTLADCARLMREKSVSALPVIDSEREVVGFLSDGDLLRAAASGGRPKAEHWMDLLGPHADDAGRHGVGGPACRCAKSPRSSTNGGSSACR
ncbi:MAG: CBS domain-containing protein [Bauldia sp.]|nr:MAG: CBS domain-containing protein [Bauldia sp.]